MKKNYILFSLAIASVGFFAFEKSETVVLEKYMESHLQNNGGQPGLTGAPGEQNCTACHVGTAQSGIGENVLTVADGFNPVTSYLPGGTYNVTLQKTSNPAKKGFSATALDNALNMAGTFAGQGIGGTQDFSGTGGRQYVSHTSTSNTSSTAVWIWTWNAPATNVGDVTFYVASNSANNNNAVTGDVIYLSTHTITADPSSGVSELDPVQESFEVGYASAGNKVIVDFQSLTSGEMFFNLVDMNGRSVFYQQMENAMIGENHQEIVVPSDLANGIYAVHYFVGNKAMTGKIMIRK